MKFNPDSVYLAWSFSMFTLRFSMQVLSFSSLSKDCEEQSSAPRLAGFFSNVKFLSQNNVAIKKVGTRLMIFCAMALGTASASCSGTPSAFLALSSGSVGENCFGSSSPC